MIRKLIYSLGIIALMGALLTPRVEAGLVLRLSANNGTTWTTITDGGAGDVNGSAGAITFVGSIGVWTLNVSTGVSKPNLPTLHEMDLNSVNVSSGAGRLIIELTDTDFAPIAGGTLIGSVGGTLPAGTGNSFEGFGFKSLSNDEFADYDLAADVHNGPFFGAGFFGSNAFDSHGAISDPYSMTIRTVITHTGAGATSFDYHLRNVVPVPAGIVLLGMGAPLLGAGYWMRRRRVAVA